MGRVITGIGASAGVAVGKILWWKKVVRNIPQAQLSTEQVDLEIARFGEAVSAAEEQIRTLKSETERRIGKKEAAVFEAHLAFLRDPAYVGEVKDRVAKEQVNAEHVLENVTTEMHDMLRALPDEYLSARADDIRDVGDRLLGILTGQEPFNPLLTPPQTVVMAEELTPSETAQLNDNVVAMVTQRGSKTGHAAIIARTMGIPMVLGVTEVDDLSDGTTVIVDGDAGVITVHPSADEVTAARQRAEEQAKHMEQVMANVKEPAVTRDGKRIDVFANIGSPKDVAAALNYGAEGIGLFRTEFLYQENDHWPTEDEQFEAYKAVLSAFGEKPVIIRTLDIGGDKKLPYFDMPQEDNPFLGERAIRFCKANPEVFRTQLRALLRAGAFGNLWILLPMVENIDEIEDTKSRLAQYRLELTAEGQTVANKIPVGIMVEIPAAAIMADALAPHVDFFSVGTNDLTQYSLAVDRGNERIAHLYDAAHPAVLRLIGMTCKAAAKANIPVGVCGELAGDARLAEVLVGLGVTELSMSAKQIAGVKAKVRTTSADSAAKTANKVLAQESIEQVYSFLKHHVESK